MKYIGRFLKFIPVIAYSCVWGIGQRMVDYYSSNPQYPDWTFTVMGIAFLLSCVVIIVHLINCIRGKYSGKEVIIYSLLLMIIPVYPCLEVLMIGLIGLVIPFFGWLATGLIIAFFYSIVVMTGIIQVGGIIRLAKEQKISSTAAVICGIMSFCFVLDIVANIYLLVKAFKKTVAPMPIMAQN